MIPSVTLLFVYALCVHRLTRLVTTDDITAPLRELLRRRAYRTEVGTRPMTGESLGQRVVVQSAVLAWLHDLVTCDWCTSIWVAAGCACAWRFAGSWFDLVAAALAMSSAAGMARERIA